MEAEKSYNLPSANWRPRKHSGTTQVEPEGLRIEKALMSIPVQGQERMKQDVQLSEAGKRG